MITYVYLVCFGKFGEGHNPITAHATLKGALDNAEKMFGVRPIHVGGVRWRATLRGVDEVEVRRLSIKDGAS